MQRLSQKAWLEVRDEVWGEITCPSGEGFGEGLGPPQEKNEFSA